MSKPIWVEETMKSKLNEKCYLLELRHADACTQLSSREQLPDRLIEW
jgi:hypothetical protein